MLVKCRSASWIGAGALAIGLCASGCATERVEGRDERVVEFEMKRADGSSTVVRLPQGYPRPRFDPTGTMVGWLDLRYAEDPSAPPQLQSLDILTPRSVFDALEAQAKREAGATADLGRRPVVVFIHGGTWSSGDKRGGLVEKAARILGDGFLLASINYRLSPTWKHPAHIEDTAAAIAWLHQHAPEFGGRPDGFVVVGHSAGAHLAALVGTDERWLAKHGLPLTILAGVACLDGGGYHLGDRTVGEPMSRRVVSSVFGPDPAVWEDASPVNHVAAGKGTPPFLLFKAGDRDVSEKETSKFAAAFAAAGLRHEVYHAAEKTHRSIHRQFGAPDDDVTTRFLQFAKEVTSTSPTAP